MHKFTILSTKLYSVVLKVRAYDQTITGQEVEDYMLDGWDNEKEHQAWLNTARVKQIADWAYAGLKNQ